MGKCRVKIHGVNISKLFKLLKKNNIEMFGIERTDYKTIFFTVKASKLKKLFAILKNSCYTISVEKYYGTIKYLQFFKKRFGYVIGAVVFASILILSNFFVSDVKVYGTKTISPAEILLTLEKSGLKKGAILSKFSTDEICAILDKNFENISLVSVIKKGTQVVINIKEKQTIDESFDVSKNDIIATKDGKILEINVVQGTANFKQGECFKAGDILVSGSFKDIHGNVVDCKAQASIKALISYETSQDYLESYTANVRTGKSITNSSFSIFGKEFLSSNKKVGFENYEVVKTEKMLFNNNFLPLKIISTTYFELEQKLVEQSFENDKISIIDNLKSKTHDLVKDKKIENEYEKIEKIENGYNVKYIVEVVEEI